VASVVTGVGAAAASSRALPGDTLYGLKRQVENVQLDLARGDVGHGRELLQQADARLSEAEDLTAGEHGSDPASVALVAQALADMDIAVTLAAEDLNRAYRETGDEEPLLLLDRFVAEQRERLDDLMLLLDPSLRERAAEIGVRLAALDREVSALLGTAIGDSASALARDARASGDGWAAGRIDRATATSTGTATDTGRAGVVEDVVDAVGDAAGGATGPGSAGSGSTGAGGTGAGPVDGIVDGVTGGGSSTAATNAPTPVPTVAVPPLPVPTPVVTDPVEAVTSAAPLPSVLPSVPCVPVPPLTAC
jgi:hypothetical protein